jgi:hypothetical protein
MSSAATGRQREHSAKRQLEALGYVVFRAPASKGIDLFCVHKNPAHTPRCIAVEIGGKSKGVARAYDALRKHNVPIDTVLLLGRCVNRQWVWNSDCFTRHKTAAAAIEKILKAAA